ncbi:MAG: nucleoside triphosphate pyrophosphatase [Candidatus Peregrinibacteria bacterium]
MIILASQSPVRAQILTQHHIPFVARPSQYEEIFSPDESLEENARRLALGKAQWVFDRLSSDEKKTQIVIGVDTIMQDPRGILLGKPETRQEALEMMERRSGKTEILYSGIALISVEYTKVSGEFSTILWKNISPEQQILLVNTGEWEGKCGGVAIEGEAGKFVEHITGSMENIMGFPLDAFQEMMAVF